jgi:serine protein kinase
MDTLRDLLEKDAENYYQSKIKKEPISILEYMELLQKDPTIAQLSHQRVYSVVSSHGYEEINEKTDPRRISILTAELGLMPGFNFRIPKLFSKELYGIEPVLFDIDNYLYMASNQGEASRQMIFFWGPPGSGKTTIAEIIRKALENHGFWQLEGCEHHDNPVNATPRRLRKKIYENFGIYIDPRADICPKCREKLIKDYDNDYTKFKVEWRNFSQRKGCGIAVVSEVDPINFNMAVLIGEEDISMLGEFKRGDPETLVLNGAFSKGERGLTEFVEIWKNPVEAQRPILTQTQERYVPAPRFMGQVYADTMLISHSNETEWRRFKSDPANEATMNRIYVVRVPHNLRLTEEVQIYRNSFLGRSTGFKNIHIDPHALEQIAMFAIFTRLAPSKKCNIIVKIKLRDGQVVMQNGEPISLTLDELIKESESEPREGMVGLSYRDMVKGIAEKSIAYYRCFWENDPYLVNKGGYINAIWVRALMVSYVRNLEIPEEGEWPKPSKRRWLAFIQDDLHHEFISLIKQDLINAYLISSNLVMSNIVSSIFNLYIENAILWVENNNLDSKSLEFIESVESELTISDNEKKAFRKEIAKTAFVLKAEGQKIGPELSPILKYAVEETEKKKLLKKILNQITTNKSKRTLIEEALTKIGYAKLGAKILIDYSITHLGRD